MIKQWLDVTITDTKFIQSCQVISNSGKPLLGITCLDWTYFDICHPLVLELFIVCNTWVKLPLLSLAANAAEFLTCIWPFLSPRFYRVKDVKQNTNHLESKLFHLLKWSKKTNLIFNPLKTKLTIYRTKKLAKIDNLNKQIQIICNKKPIE